MNIAPMFVAFTAGCRVSAITPIIPFFGPQHDPLTQKDTQNG